MGVTARRVGQQKNEGILVGGPKQGKKHTVTIASVEEYQQSKSKKTDKLESLMFALSINDRERLAEKGYTEDDEIQAFILLAVRKALRELEEG